MAILKNSHIENSKITKGDIIQQHIDTQSVCDAGNITFCDFAVFDVRVL